MIYLFSYSTMSARKAFKPSGLKYKPIYKAPPPPPPPRAKPKLAPLLMGGAILYVSATYVSMLVFKSKNDTNDIVAGNGPSGPEITPKLFDTSSVWENVAKKYDQEIGWDEIVMGVGLLRRWLIGKAKVVCVCVCVSYINKCTHFKLQREMFLKYPQAQDATLIITSPRK